MLTIQTINELPTDLHNQFHQLVEESSIQFENQDRFADNWLKVMKMPISAETKIGNEIGVMFEYESALTAIANGHIPSHAWYFQNLVVRLAYNAITNQKEFEWIVENSQFSNEQVQKLIDTAVVQVLQHPNFQIKTLEEPEYTDYAEYLEYLYDKEPKLLQVTSGNLPCSRCGCDHDRD